MEEHTNYQPRRRPRRGRGPSAGAARSPRGATRPGSRGQSRPAGTPAGRPRRAVTPRERLARFFPTVIVPLALVIAVLVVVAFAALLIGGGTLRALPGIVAAGWLVVNGGPVAFEDVTLGIVPLLPALGLVWLVAARVRRRVRHRATLQDLGVLAGYCLAAPLVLTLIAWAVLAASPEDLPTSAPPLGHALATTLVLYAGAFAAGLPPRLWRAAALRLGVAGWVVDGAGLAARFLIGLVAAGGIVLFGALVVGAPRLGEIAEAFAGPGGVAAAALLSILYLPNAAAATAAVLVGAGLEIGPAEVSLFSVHLVALPPLPLFAAVPPEAHPAAWLLLALPAIVAIRVVGVRVPRPRETVVAALTVAVVVFAGLYVAGGEMGAYGWTGGSLVAGALAAAGWLAAAGLVGRGIVVAREYLNARAAASGIVRPRARAREDNTGTIDNKESNENTGTTEAGADAAAEGPAGEPGDGADYAAEQTEPAADAAVDAEPQPAGDDSVGDDADEAAAGAQKAAGEEPAERPAAEDQPDGVEGGDPARADAAPDGGDAAGPEAAADDPGRADGGDGDASRGDAADDEGADPEAGDPGDGAGEDR